MCGNSAQSQKDIDQAVSILERNYCHFEALYIIFDERQRTNKLRY